MKPLTKLGLYTSAVVYVRDGRYETFSDSPVGMVEVSLHNGLTFFNCFPTKICPFKISNSTRSLAIRNTYKRV